MRRQITVSENERGSKRCSGIRIVWLLIQINMVLISGSLSTPAGLAQEAETPKQQTSLDASNQPPRDGQQELRGLTLSGLTADEANQGRADVHLTLYRMKHGLAPVEIANTRSNPTGLFQFSEVPSIEGTESEGSAHYVVVATAEKRASVIKRISTSSDGKITLEMRPAEKFSGRILDPEGVPEQGAVIWCEDFSESPLANAMSAISDADGKFTIVDLPSCRKDQQPIDPLQSREKETDRIYRIVVHHPDFADQVLGVVQFPEFKTITLAHSGQVGGKVVDAVTGKPAAGIAVTIQPTKQTSIEVADRNWLRFAQTNSDGVYEFKNLAAAEYNVWTSAPERTCVALNSFPITKNQRHQAPDLELIEGGWIEGRILTLLGQPVSRDPTTGDRLRVGLNGPARPRSGTSFESCTVGEDGHFRLRAPAGRNFPYLISTSAWSQIWRKEKFEQGIDVADGQTLKVTFRVRNTAPISPPARRPARDPVKLPPPVDNERDAAETIRDLGGWYQLDEEGHVVEINMVYNDRTGVRYDNDYVDTDEAMRIAPAFPRLKRLLLRKGQATDDSMACLADLEGLDKFYVWDATGLTDACAPHLGHLKNLTSVHVSQGGIGDDTLKVLADLPKLQRMSLQGNAFTDAGLAHLARATQLRSAWIGMSTGTITDAGLQHLMDLKHLEQLEVQQSEVTEEGIATLKKKLPHLRIIK